MWPRNGGPLSTPTLFLNDLMNYTGLGSYVGIFGSIAAGGILQWTSTLELLQAPSADAPAVALGMAEVDRPSHNGWLLLNAYGMPQPGPRVDSQMMDIDGTIDDIVPPTIQGAKKLLYPITPYVQRTETVPIALDPLLTTLGCLVVVVGLWPAMHLVETAIHERRRAHHQPESVSKRYRTRIWSLVLLAGLVVGASMWSGMVFLLTGLVPQNVQPGYTTVSYNGGLLLGAFPILLALTILCFLVHFHTVSMGRRREVDPLPLDGLVPANPDREAVGTTGPQIPVGVSMDPRSALSPPRAPGASTEASAYRVVAVSPRRPPDRDDGTTDGGEGSVAHRQSTGSTGSATLQSEPDGSGAKTVMLARRWSRRFASLHPRHLWKLILASIVSTTAIAVAWVMGWRAWTVSGTTWLETGPFVGYLCLGFVLLTVGTWLMFHLHGTAWRWACLPIVLGGWSSITVGGNLSLVITRLAIVIDEPVGLSAPLTIQLVASAIAVVLPLLSLWVNSSILGGSINAVALRHEQLTLSLFQTQHKLAGAEATAEAAQKGRRRAIAACQAEREAVQEWMTLERIGCVFHFRHRRRRGRSIR